MSDTPRTDEMEKLISPTIYMVKADFARQLERELNKANEELRAYREGGLTDEILRRNDGYIKVNKGCAIVSASERAEILRELDEWRKCATSLAASLRSEMRGEDARYSETGRPCAQSDLEEFNRLASKP